MITFCYQTQKKLDIMVRSTFDCATLLLGAEVNTAIRSAPEKYRNHHARVRRSYKEYAIERGI